MTKKDELIEALRIENFILKDLIKAQVKALKSMDEAR